MHDSPTNSVPDGPIGAAIFVVLCVAVVFAVLAFGAVDPFAIGVLSITILICVVLWMLDAWQSGELKYSSEKVQLPIIGLILLGLVQMLPLGNTSAFREILSISPSSSLSLDMYSTQMFVVRLVLILVFLAAGLTFISTQARVKRLLIVLITFGTLIGFYAILQKIAYPGAIYGLRETPQAISFGPYVNQHHFASLMVMLSAPVIGLIACGSLKRDYLPLLWIATVMMAIAIVFSGSRGGILSYAMMVGLILFVSGRHKASRDAKTEDSRFGLRIIKFAGIIVLGFVSLGIIFYLGAGEGLLRGLGVSADANDVSSGRFHFWGVALKMFLANPIIGVGLDAFGVAFAEFDTQNGLFRVEQAHNEYLQMLADSGLVGFTCVAVFIFFLLKQGLAQITAVKNRTDLGVRLGAFAGCVAILIHSFFDFPLRTNANTFIFMLLIIIALTNVEFVKTSKRRKHTNAHGQ